MTKDGKVAHTSPTFCKVVFVVDLLLSGLRIVFAVIGGFAFVTTPSGNPQRWLMLAECLTCSAMALCGIAANILFLVEHPFALPMGLANVAATLSSYAVAAFSVVMVGSQAMAQGQVAGFAIGAILSLGSRLAVLLAYLIALYFYKQWWDEYQAMPATTAPSTSPSPSAPAEENELPLT